jgi:Uma2 family endonuclease
MPTVVVPYHGTIQIPNWVKNLASFRTWVHSRVLPEKLAVHFLQGDVWVDFEIEEAFTHNFVKAAVLMVLMQVAKADRSGVAFADGMLLTNDDAEMGTEPDAMYVSYKSFETKRVWFTAGETTGAQATELVGSPDLVVEIISPSSEDKDTEWLMTQYYDAGVTEYWLIDARGDDIRFDIYRHGPKGFVATRKDGGWVKSRLLKRSFRMTRAAGIAGLPDYALDIR